jgi:hypothetical protein
MTDIFCNKVKTATSYALLPAHQQDEGELKKLPKGQPLRVKVTRIRNVDHHRKYFALLNYAFDVWEPPVAFGEHEFTSGKFDSDLVQPEKNFDRFRKDIAILAGFYEATYRINGDVRLEAKSISFGNMDQDEFDKLYDKTIDVIIKHVLRNYEGDELRAVVDQVMEFDA